VPLENQAQVDKIRPVLSKKEAMALIDKIPYNKLEWIEDRNDRKDAFADIIVNGSREDIMSMIHLIKCHAKKLSGEGKHLNAQDERALNDARVRMNNEIALALDIEPENVVELIQEKMGEVDFA
jgi:RNA polymerase-interacting CarD/CdnL/TRCF family regulator